MGRKSDEEAKKKQSKGLAGKNTALVAVSGVGKYVGLQILPVPHHYSLALMLYHSSSSLLPPHFMKMFISSLLCIVHKGNKREDKGFIQL
jgi:hypothetical protein